MATLFDTPSLPPWLSRTSAQSDALASRIGETVGLNLAAGVRWATQSDNTNPVDPKTGKQERISFDQAYVDAKQNNENPLWRIHAATAKNQLLQQGIALQGQQLQLEQNSRENTNWLNAAPTVSSWLTATPEERKTMPKPETFGSQKAMQLIEQKQQQDQLNDYKKQMEDIARMKADTLIERGKLEAQKERDAVEKDRAALQEKSAHNQAIEDLKQQEIELRKKGQSEPIQAQPLIDKTTGKPVSGVLIIPNSKGDGWIHLTPPDSNRISPATALSILKQLPTLEAQSPGVTAQWTQSLTDRIGSALSQETAKAAPSPAPLSQGAAASSTTTPSPVAPFKTGKFTVVPEN